MSNLEAKQISNSIYYSEDTNIMAIMPEGYPPITIPNSYIFDDGTIVILYSYYYGDDDLSAGYTFGFSAGYMESNLYIPRFPNDIHIMITSANEIESKLEDHTLNFDTFKVNSLSSEFSELLNKNYFISPSSIIIEPDYSSNAINIVFSAFGFEEFLFGKLTYNVKSNSFTGVNKLVTGEIGLDYYLYSNPILVKISDNKYKFLISEGESNYVYIDFDLEQKTYSKQHFLPNITEYDIRFADFLFYNEQNNTIVVAGFKHLITDKNLEGYCKLGPLAFYELDVNTFNVLRHTDFIDAYFKPLICDASFYNCEDRLPTIKIANRKFINVSFSEVYNNKTLVSLTCSLFCDKKYYVVLLDLDNFSFVENSFVNATPICKGVNAYRPNYLHSTIASDGKFILMLESYY